MLVTEPFIRGIIGFAVHGGSGAGVTLCREVNEAITQKELDLESFINLFNKIGISPA